MLSVETRFGWEQRLLQAFLASTGLVALAELGDKTQLLVLLLAARYRRPGVILAAVASAIVLLQMLAVAFGAGAQRWLPSGLPALLAGAVLLVVSLWLLRVENEPALQVARRASRSLFVGTLLAFTVAEMADKSQLATLALAVRYAEWPAVLAGAVCGELLALTPAVLLGARLAPRIPELWIKRAAALVFALTGLYLLLDSLT